jgi:hypothetical protein
LIEGAEVGLPYLITGRRIQAALVDLVGRQRQDDRPIELSDHRIDRLEVEDPDFAPLRRVADRVDLD